MRIYLGISLLMCCLLAQTHAAAASSCLSGDPTAAGDVADLTAVRDLVDGQCPCESFTGALGHTRRDYQKCAKAVLKAALASGRLRSQCRGTATYPFSRSVCGASATKPLVSCIHTSRSGKVSCKVAAPIACERSHSTACPGIDNCLDAADTNHDHRVGAGDSGACNAIVPCANPPRPDGASCDDGVACTKDDACVGHVCTGSAYVCGAPDACHQSGVCNGDGTCAFAAKPDGTTCDSGVDTRPPLTCSAGSCGVCTPPGTCSTTTSRSCALDGHCPSGETCVLGPTASPRFVDNRDGTITDRQTCLVWEKKGGYDGTPVVCLSNAACTDPHDANNRYAWSSNGTAPDGPAFTVFLAALNTAGFAGHSNWRLPVGLGIGTAYSAPNELASLVDTGVPGCGGGSACTPAAFQTGCTPSCNPDDVTCSCTAPAATWTDRTAAVATQAWSVAFNDGTTNAVVKTTAAAVRAVRGGLPFLDCVASPIIPQSRIDGYVIECFNGCINTSNQQECIQGCTSGAVAVYDEAQAAQVACTTDPGAGCDGIGAALQDYCAMTSSPPAFCVQSCSGDAVCEGYCAQVGDCTRAAQNALADCNASSR